MNLYHIRYSLFFYYTYFILDVITTPQMPEINDQYENITAPQKTQGNPVIPTADIQQIAVQDNEIVKPLNDTGNHRADLILVQESITTRLCKIISTPFFNLVAAPKVNSVLRNIGTCIVNGVMEIITYYFPAPLIPLIATAAGMVIPFEPVVMLREKMPVTSYRRAFRTALNSFLSTFDRYRLDDEEDDPYMMRRFNRRLMNDDEGEKVTVKRE